MSSRLQLTVQDDIVEEIKKGAKKRGLHPLTYAASLLTLIVNESKKRDIFKDGFD